jgi:iron complex outermembrane receptor protein
MKQGVFRCHTHPGWRSPRPEILAVVMLTAVLAVPGAGAVDPPSHDFADLSLEELGNIDVTSVSKKTERLSDAAASIFVITGEDIRRAGATSLPEALRLAPNLQVSRVDASDYAISARGFNSTAGNKLLVLIDGRSVYTPLFSGVFWDVQDVLLEDVERIEVISGPGATLWGANAVNGVINVITRSARDTQGGFVAPGAGNLEAGAAARYGAQLDSGGHFRVYGKYFDRQNTERADGSEVRDDWDKGQVGFRADWNGASESFTLQGDAYSGKLDQAAPGTPEIDGMNLLARWSRSFADGSSLRLQGYYDRTERDIPGTFAEDLDILDFELQHSIRPTAGHEVVWGGGYRYANDSVTNSAALAFIPADKSLNWVNVFAQDGIALRENLHLTLGIKIEHNDYSGFEFLPSARIAWKPAPERLVWSAVSRAVRAPSRIDQEFFIPGNPPFQIAGGPDFRSEVSNTFELGYRAQPTSAISYSVTAFHSIHDHIRSVEPIGGGVSVLGNKIEGKTSGVEAWGSYQATRAWRLSGGVVLLRQRLELKPDSTSLQGVRAEGNDPKHRWMLRSSYELTERHEFDIIVRHVGELPDPVVPAYTAVDARFGWKANRNLELSLTLQNIFDPSHPEFGAPATRSELERSAYAKLLWRF